MPASPSDPHLRPDTAHGLVLYVRHGCHLCDQFLVDLSLELGPALDQLQVIDVDSDTDLAVRYGLRVPVLEAHGQLICEAALDPVRLKDALRL